MIFSRGHFNTTAVRESKITNTLNLVKSLYESELGKYDSTVFLSHKHSDLNDLEGVMGLLEALGAKVYIDSIDNKMPGQTSGETATRIKSIIKSCKKFILLATDDAIESFWCNWELGIGDTHKFIRHIAILPIKEAGKADYQYKGNEYLQIYPRIDYYDGKSTYRNSNKIIEQGYYVCTPKDKEGIVTATSLKSWLKS